MQLPAASATRTPPQAPVRRVGLAAVVALTSVAVAGLAWVGWGAIEFGLAIASRRPAPPVYASVFAVGLAQALAGLGFAAAAVAGHSAVAVRRLYWLWVALLVGTIGVAATLGLRVPAVPHAAAGALVLALAVGAGWRLQREVPRAA